MIYMKQMAQNKLIEHKQYIDRLPWALAFSFARAIRQPAMEIWRGKEAQVLSAQRALYHRARCNRAARCGEYSAAMEECGVHKLQWGKNNPPLKPRPS
jgi:fructose-bisphosphate aldolase class 1